MKRFTILLSIVTFCAIVATSCTNHSSAEVKTTTETTSCKDKTIDSKNCDEQKSENTNEECCKETGEKTTTPATDKKYGKGVITPSTEAKRIKNKK